MFYNVFRKDSAAPQSTTSLNMDSRREITVLTKLVFRLYSLSFQRLQAYFMHAPLQKQVMREILIFLPLLLLYWAR